MTAVRSLEFFQSDNSSMEKTTETLSRCRRPEQQAVSRANQLLLSVGLLNKITPGALTLAMPILHIV